MVEAWIETVANLPQFHLRMLDSVDFAWLEGDILGQRASAMYHQTSTVAFAIKSY